MSEEPQLTDDIIDSLAAEVPILCAARRFVDSLLPKASYTINSAPVWHGWALRDAFVAGVKWQREKEIR